MGDRDGAIRDLELWTSAHLVTDALTLDKIKRKYRRDNPNNDFVSELHPQELGFEKVLEGDDLSVLDCILHFRRIETIHEGLRWFDIKRYGIVIYSYGYIRTKAGYQREKVEKAASKVLDSAIEKLTGISGLTNPSKNYSVSDPYGNILYCAVVDSQTDEVIHFVNETPTLASHPTENRDVNELVHKLLKEFIR